MADGHWTLSEAARVLGIARDTLRRRIKATGIATTTIGNARVLDDAQVEQLRTLIDGRFKATHRGRALDANDAATT